MKILIFALSFLSITATAQQAFRYDLEKPDIRHQLPAILNEISGLTDLDSNSVACVQDELGTIFIYDFKKGEITSRHTFDITGDFEGLTFTGKDLFILRSDGRLTEWKNFLKPKNSYHHSNLPVVTNNNEGLCYDPKYNRILIAAKSKPNEKELKSERYIYAYDLSKSQFNPKPVYSINIDQLTTKAMDLNFKPIKADNAKGKKNLINFRPASLSVHPSTDEIYIISAVDRMLVVMNRKGEITHIKALPPDLYAKAEGITFLGEKRPHYMSLK